jgi:hypothetical protein
MYSPVKISRNSHCFENVEICHSKLDVEAFFVLLTGQNCASRQQKRIMCSQENIDKAKWH